MRICCYQVDAKAVYGERRKSQGDRRGAPRSKSSGTGNLVVRLEDSSGTQIDSFTVSDSFMQTLNTMNHSARGLQQGGMPSYQNTGHLVFHF